MSNLEAITMLSNLGVSTSAVVSYRGQDNEAGYVTNIALTPSSGFKTTNAKWRDDLAAHALSTVIAELVGSVTGDSYHSGFGGYGTVTYDVANSKIIIDHTQRMTSSDCVVDDPISSQVVLLVS